MWALSQILAGKSSLGPKNHQSRTIQEAVHRDNGDRKADVGLEVARKASWREGYWRAPGRRHSKGKREWQEQACGVHRKRLGCCWAADTDRRSHNFRCCLPALQTGINRGAPIIVYRLSPTVSYSHSFSSASLCGVGVRDPELSDLDQCGAGICFKSSCQDLCLSPFSMQVLDSLGATSPAALLPAVRPT